MDRTLKEAMAADQSEHCLEAMRLYQAALDQPDGTLTPNEDLLARLNLAVLNCDDWMASDPSAPQEMMNVSYQTALNTLEEAVSRYPSSPEAEFWQEHARCILGETDDTQGWERLLQKFPDSSLIRLGFLMFSKIGGPNSVEYQELMRLAEEVLEGLPEKRAATDRYLWSVLSSMIGLR